MFIISQDYDRNELLEFIGSKQVQSGIIWGKKDNSCVIVTSGGRGGKSAGYGDIKNDDGSFYYIGQGEKGDQNTSKYSNSLLINGDKSILFFSTREPNAEEVRKRGNYRKLYRFEGIYQVASWDFFVPSEGKRINNRLLKFLLVPAKNIFNVQSTFVNKQDETIYVPKTLEELKKRLSNINGKPKKGQSSSREYFIRSLDIINYAKKRAQGYCERCNVYAPFLDFNNFPFLEVHHIYRLADDGPDLPENVAAICPNCHKEAHYGIEKEKIKEDLSKSISEKEKLIIAAD